MNTTYALAVNQTHSAIERYTTDAVQKLQCKPGYEQRGAACQPKEPKKSGVSVVRGLANSALAGAGVGLLGADLTAAHLNFGELGNQYMMAKNQASEAEQKLQSLFEKRRTEGDRTQASTFDKAEQRLRQKKQEADDNLNKVTKQVDRRLFLGRAGATAAGALAGGAVSGGGLGRRLAGAAIGGVVSNLTSRVKRR